MNLKKEYLEYLSSSEDFSPEYIKDSIYKGKILVFRNFPQIIEINNLCKKYFKKILKKELKPFLSSKDQTNIGLEKLIFTLQKEIKTCKLIKKAFSSFLENIKFEIDDTFCDKITLRFSPEKNVNPLGFLKPVGPHRDTWASNVFHQINWWFPIHDVDKDYSIYIAPYYFCKKVKNDSNNWSFKLFKKKGNFLSTPVSVEKLDEQKKIKLSVKFGEVLCFSGNHLHGSSIGLKKRINIETRTVCSKDPKKYKIPKNIDSNNKKKKYEWFKSLLDNSSYPDV